MRYLKVARELLVYTRDGADYTPCFKGAMTSTEKLVGAGRYTARLYALVDGGLSTPWRRIKQ